MAMIYDTFLFHGECDLLEIRLNVLDKVVDKFVICEAKQSFSGEPYESLYLKNKERFKQWEDKIIYYKFNLLEDPELVKQAKESKNTSGNPYWMKVYYAMEMMRKPLENCKEDDIIFISDCDEIWNPDIEIKTDGEIYGLEQIVYYYQLNNRCSEAWQGTIYTVWARLKNQQINEYKQKGEIKLPNGGWHFTYMGGEEQVRFKVLSSRTPGEQDQTDSFYGTPTELILENAKNNRDIFAGRFNDPARAFTYTTDESQWPIYLKENREKYLHLLK